MSSNVDVRNGYCGTFTQQWHFLDLKLPLPSQCEQCFRILGLVKVNGTGFGGICPDNNGIAFLRKLNHLRSTMVMMPN